MKLGIALEDRGCLQSNVVRRFVKSNSFFLLDIDKNKIIGSRIVESTSQRDGSGRAVVDELMRYRVTHVIAGGIGTGAQAKFAKAGVKVLCHSGKAKEAIDDFLKNKFTELGARRDRGTRK